MKKNIYIENEDNIDELSSLASQLETKQLDVVKKIKKENRKSTNTLSDEQPLFDGGYASVKRDIIQSSPPSAPIDYDRLDDLDATEGLFGHNEIQDDYLALSSDAVDDEFAEMQPEVNVHQVDEDPMARKAKKIKRIAAGTFAFLALGTILLNCTGKIMEYLGDNQATNGQPAQTQQPEVTDDATQQDAINQHIGPSVYIDITDDTLTNVSAVDVLRLQKHFNELMIAQYKQVERILSQYSTSNNADNLKDNLLTVFEESEKELAGIAQYKILYDALEFTDVYTQNVERIKNLKNYAASIYNLKDPANHASLVKTYTTRENDLSSQAKLNLLKQLDKQKIPYQEVDGGVRYEAQDILEVTGTINLMPVQESITDQTTPEPVVSADTPTDNEPNDSLDDGLIVDAGEMEIVIPEKKN